ncbi:MAG: fatty acid CoA ligase family protein [Pirellulaceae bacterium]|nr:fatty acid CoA ligase family protein [Pirellulaceae bacterium]
MVDPAHDNVAALLHATAQRDPEGVAVVEPGARVAGGRRRYRQVTFRELDEDSTKLAASLRARGARSGLRMVLLVRPGIDFISLVFALFKAGLVAVLIDPGMGRRHLLRCLAEAGPDGFVAIPLAQAIRVLCRRSFPQARLNVTVGRRWFWGGPTLEQLRRRPVPAVDMTAVSSADPAAIIFTTGSTGPPKGVLYRHGNFTQQAREIQRFYAIAPGEIDLAGFPLFALFNCAMGVTTVIPDMDPTRPAQVNPRNILEAVQDWRVTQSFGSPALWNVVGRYCEEHRVVLPTLRRVLSAGAPVPAHVIQRMKHAIAADGDIHTPYGATEALPVASIAGREILHETMEQTARGAGTCVGSRFPGIDWKVIRIRDDAIDDLRDAEELPAGEIGELMVRGAVVTTEYVTRTEANALHKVRDGDSVWHRMGDVGYLDARDRFWFCGRKAHRVRTEFGTLFTIPCEAIINQHPAVYRSALVGLGPPGRQLPVIIVETWPEGRPAHVGQERALLAQLRDLAQRHPLTERIRHFLLHPGLPVDIRHNAKIFREKLAAWVQTRHPEILAQHEKSGGARDAPPDSPA